MKCWWAIPILVILFTSCSGSVQEDIIGYWEGDTLKQDMSFTADGQVEIIDLKYSTYTGTYIITDGNVLTCDIDHPIFRDPVVRTIKIKGDKLILMEKSRKEIYRRRN